jgi:serine/threonine-protein phosphatase 4 regulatory subunit 1
VLIFGDLILQLLRPPDRNLYLPRLSEFLLTDNQWNWRFREELANQLLATVNLFTPEDTRKHLTPIAIALLLDKVAAVRQVALCLVSLIFFLQMFKVFNIKKP